MKVAVFTMVRDEEFFLPIWYKYYSDQFDKDDIFILDNDSEKPIEYPNVKPVHSKYVYDHDWMRKTIKDHMAILLSNYNYVIYVDVDELLVVDSLTSRNIIDYIYNTNLDTRVNKGYTLKTHYATGYEILQDTGLWIELNTFYKPVISSEPQTHIMDYKNKYAAALNGLYLLHLNRISYEEAFKAYSRKLKILNRWNPNDIPTTKGWQHRMKSIHEFDDYFYNVKNTSDIPEPIPERFKKVINEYT